MQTQLSAMMIAGLFDLAKLPKSNEMDKKRRKIEEGIALQISVSFDFL